MLLLEMYVGSGFYCEIVSCAFPYSVFHRFTVDTVHASVFCTHFLRGNGCRTPRSWCSFLAPPEEYKRIGLFWESGFRVLFAWLDSGYTLMRQSMEVGISHVFPREGGPRIPQGRSWRCLRSTRKLDFYGRCLRELFLRPRVSDSHLLVLVSPEKCRFGGMWKIWAMTSGSGSAFGTFA